MNATTMSRAFSKWWDRRRGQGEHRGEADLGWKTGAQWALEQAVQRLEHGLSGRPERAAEDEERRQCAEEIRELARDLPSP